MNTKGSSCKATSGAKSQSLPNQSENGQSTLLENWSSCHTASLNTARRWDECILMPYYVLRTDAGHRPSQGSGPWPVSLISQCAWKLVLALTIPIPLLSGPTKPCAYLKGTVLNDAPLSVICANIEQLTDLLPIHLGQPKNRRDSPLAWNRPTTAFLERQSCFQRASLRLKKFTGHALFADKQSG